MIEYDDFLGLSAIDFSRSRMVLFHGVSGSGKSTAIRFLTDRHRDFESSTFQFRAGPPFARHVGPSAPCLVVDEILRPVDLVRVLPSLLRSRVSLVATHLSPLWFIPLRIAGAQKIFRTDRGVGKLARWLERRGIEASEVALARYEAMFRANYTDLEVILERCPSERFDESLRRFERFCTIENTPSTWR